MAKVVSGSRARRSKVADEAASQDPIEGLMTQLLVEVGEDPDRNGLLNTPKRVAKAYRELFAGYDADIDEVLGTTFEEVAGYNDIVLVRDIPFFSHCEHHMLPVIGKAHVAYFPVERVVGLSKIARIVDIFARRLQTQEAMVSGPGPRGSAPQARGQRWCGQSEPVYRHRPVRFQLVLFLSTGLQVGG